jgi:PhnB protein
VPPAPVAAGGFEDPYGHLWSVHTRVEDVSPEEIGKRVEKFMQDGGAG